jgi:hypothetical protein
MPSYKATLKEMQILAPSPRIVAKGGAAARNSACVAVSRAVP